MERHEGCELCEDEGGEVLLHDPFCRVVLPGNPDHPAVCRVIVHRHVREMTDLGTAEQERLMRVVFAVERALRSVMAPDKVNLASLGNVTPHLHWHVIPRFHDDRHFPDAVWSAPRREAKPAPPGLAEALSAALRADQEL